MALDGVKCGVYNKTHLDLLEAVRTKKSRTERVVLPFGRKTDEEVNFICRVLFEEREILWV